MTRKLRTAVDTNVFSALWSSEPTAQLVIRLLGQARSAGSIAICGPVYAELFAHPKVTSGFVDKFLTDTEVQIDFDCGEKTWRDVARSYALYAERRRRSDSNSAKRLLVDFVVGAHAMHHADQLLTLDASRYRTDFPELKVIG
jgi:predicted nucleic acid-binding protein